MIIAGCVKCDQVETADTDKGIDNSGQPGHAAKQCGDKVKMKKSDESPVDCANDGNGESNAI